MRKLLPLALTLLLMLCPALSAVACTSFAVYGEAPLYGMNWDYPFMDYTLAISDYADYHRVFHIQFETEYGVATNASMNDVGYFTAVQDLLPRVEPSAPFGDDTVEDMHDMAKWSPFVYDQVEDVRALLTEKHVGSKYYTMHTLVADATGDALVLEEDEAGENVVSAVENGHLMMTNFRVHDLKTHPYDDLLAQQGTIPFANFGIDRYQTVKDRIELHPAGFDVATAFAALEAAAQTRYYSTLYSGVYDPIHGEIYVALYQNYAQIWKVSLGEKTITTHTGFKTPATFPLTEEGILASTLNTYARENR